MLNIVAKLLFFAAFAVVSFAFASDDYEEYLQSVKAVRDSLNTEYVKANSTKAAEIHNFSRNFLLKNIVERSFDFWSGTKWDFYGKTRVPKSGKIACGYFVTTVLYDMGLNIPRVKWAQSASEVFIMKLSNTIARYSNKPIADVLTYINTKPEGLYIIGLDCHVGFIYKHNGHVRFVHSNYYQPEIGVMQEELDSENPLRDSKYRVIGRILDDTMITKWLTNSKYE